MTSFPSQSTMRSVDVLTGACFVAAAYGWVVPEPTQTLDRLSNELFDQNFIPFPVPTTTKFEGFDQFWRRQAVCPSGSTSCGPNCRPNCCNPSFDIFCSGASRTCTTVSGTWGCCNSGFACTRQINTCTDFTSTQASNCATCCPSNLPACRIVPDQNGVFFQQCDTSHSVGDQNFPASLSSASSSSSRTTTSAPSLSSSSSSSTPPPSGGHKGLSSGAAAGIGVGAAVGAIAFGVLLFFAWRGFKRNKTKHEPIPQASNFTTYPPHQQGQPYDPHHSTGSNPYYEPKVGAPPTAPAALSPGGRPLSAPFDPQSAFGSEGYYGRIHPATQHAAVELDASAVGGQAISEVDSMSVASPMTSSAPASSGLGGGVSPGLPRSH